jgi:hypothetical protein
MLAGRESILPLSEVCLGIAQGVLEGRSDFCRVDTDFYHCIRVFTPRSWRKPLISEIV